MNPFLTYLPLAFLIVGCASDTVVTETPVMMVPNTAGTTIAPQRVGAVRNGEILKAYKINPYIDPNNRKIRHDGHTIARVEQDPTWNLRPNNTSELLDGPNTQAPLSAYAPMPLTTELQTTLAQQQRYSAAILEVAKAQDNQLKTMDKALSEMNAVAQQNAELKAHLAKVQTDLEKIKQEEAAAKEKQETKATQDALPFYKKWVK